MKQHIVHLSGSLVTSLSVSVTLCLYASVVPLCVRVTVSPCHCAFFSEWKQGRKSDKIALARQLYSCRRRRARWSANE